MPRLIAATSKKIFLAPHNITEHEAGKAGIIVFHVIGMTRSGFEPRLLDSEARTPSSFAYSAKKRKLKRTWPLNSIECVAYRIGRPEFKQQLSANAVKPTLRS